MADNRVTLILRGTSPEGDEVPADLFVDQLGALLDALEATDRSISRGLKTADWVVVDLHRRSPTTVELEARPRERGWVDDVARIVPAFISHVQRLQVEPTAPRELSRRGLEALQRMAQPVGEGRLRSIIRNGTQGVPLEPVMLGKTQAALLPTQEAVGSLEGQLERINIHGRANSFWIYPWVGPSKVKCSFPEELVNRAGSMLGQWVTVTGTLVYPARSDHASEIRDVSMIDPLPAGAGSLKSLRGVAPEATGDLSTGDYLRGIRDEW